MAFDKKKYDQQYAKENYDRILFNVQKGEKEIIMDRAKERGFKTLSDYLKSLVYKDLEESKSRKI